MINILQILTALFCVAGTLIMLVLLAFSELNFLDNNFSLYFGVLGIVAAISFFILVKNEDNEETNPAKEKPRR